MGDIACQGYRLLLTKKGGYRHHNPRN